jgi:hypothetical protein
MEKHMINVDAFYLELSWRRKKTRRHKIPTLVPTFIRVVM